MHFTRIRLRWAGVWTAILNNIETRWGPAKRAILEPDRLLTAEEVVSRVCEHFGVIRLPYLKSRAAEAVKD